MNADQLFWATARAGGIVTWALVTMSVLWGLALSTRALGRNPRPNWILDLHRFLGGAALVFGAIHVLSIMADSYVSFGPVEVLVPFTGDWNPVAVGWGIIGMYLLVAVEITSLLRKRISKRAWRLTHFLSFPLFVLGTAHSLTAGTDAANPILLGVMWMSVAAVAGLTALRAYQSQRPLATPRPIP